LTGCLFGAKDCGDSWQEPFFIIDAATGAIALLAAFIV
jgi:hypothetical protein